MPKYRTIFRKHHCFSNFVKPWDGGMRWLLLNKIMLEIFSMVLQKKVYCINTNIYQSLVYKEDAKKELLSCRFNIIEYYLVNMGIESLLVKCIEAVNNIIKESFAHQNKIDKVYYW